MSASIQINFPPELVPEVAEHINQLARTSESPWMKAEGAAEYIDAPVSRIRKLTSKGEIPHHHEGGRVLYHREELDEFVRSGKGGEDLG